MRGSTPKAMRNTTKTTGKITEKVASTTPNTLTRTTAIIIRMRGHMTGSTRTGKRRVVMIGWLRALLERKLILGVMVVMGVIFVVLVIVLIILVII